MSFTSDPTTASQKSGLLPRQTGRGRALVGLGRETPVLLAFLAFAALLLHNYGWQQFVDESDNLLGGLMISHGWVLYRDYFSHHMPLPYYLAALFASLSADSLLEFRLYTGAVYSGLVFFLYLIFRSVYSRATWAALFVALGFMHPIFWGHMLLAESVRAYGMLGVLIYCHALASGRATRLQLVVAVALAYWSLGTALLSVYPLAACALFVLAWLLRKRKEEVRRVGAGKIGATVALLVLPALGYAAVLLWQGTLRAFYEQAIEFNSLYYARYILDATPQALLLNWTGYYAQYVATSLAGALVNPVPALLVIANASAAFLVARRFGASLGITHYTAVALSAMRSADWYSAGYFVLSALSVALLAGALAERTPRTWRGAGAWSWRRTRGPVSFACYGAGVLLLLALAAGLLRTYPYLYSPPIYDRAYLPVIQAVVPEGEPIWAAPLEPILYLEARRAPASRYAFYLPWMADSPTIRATLLADLERAAPPVIIFDGERSIWARGALKDYGREVYDFLLRHYTPLGEDTPAQRTTYFRNDRLGEMQARMRSSGVEVAGIEQRPQSGFLSPRLSDGVRVGQTFTARPGLYRVDLYLATFNRVNQGQAVLRVYDGARREILAEARFDTAAVSDNFWHTVRLPSALDEAGELYLEVEAPGGPVGSGVAVYTSRDDGYPGGQAYFDGKPQPRDLAFAAYFRD